jgi:hypothetical protein
MQAQPPRRGRLLASSFERDTAGWAAIHNAKLRRRVGNAPFGRAFLEIGAGARSRSSGAQFGAIDRIRSASHYTLTLAADIPQRKQATLYVDEFNSAKRWLAHRTESIDGQGTWRRYTWSWTTTPSTAQLRLSVLNSNGVHFYVDGIQLQAGIRPLPFAGRDKIPSPTRQSAIYNTWLALAVEDGVLSAFLFSIVVSGACYLAFRRHNYATACALGAMLAPSLSENLIFGESYVTLIWLAALGLTISSTRNRYTRPRGPVLARPRA